MSDFLKKDIESLDFNSIVNKTNFFFKYKNCVISFKFLLFDLSQRIHYNLTLLTYLLLHLSRFYLLLFDENKNNYIEYKKTQMNNKDNNRNTIVKQVKKMLLKKERYH